MRRPEDMPLHKRLLEELNAKPSELVQRNDYGKKEINLMCFRGELTSLIYKVEFEISVDFDSFKIRVIERLTDPKIIFNCTIKDYDLFIEVKNLIINKYIKI